MRWTSSNTSQYLTPYAEGLACRYFDRRDDYTTRSIKENEWLVIHTSSLINCNTQKVHSEPSTKFCRVRKVQIKGDFITCSCGHVQRWLMPCVHIYAVLDKQELVLPSMFHLHWWKHFNYLFKNTSKDNNESVQLKLHESLKHVRMNHFDKNNNNQYIGCPIHDNILLKTKIYEISELPTEDETLLKMLAIRDSQFINVPWQTTKQISPFHYASHDKNSLSASNLSMDIDMEIDFESNDVLEIKVEENIDSMGGGIVHSNLSQQRQDMFDDDISNNSHNNCEIGAYHRLKPLFDQLVSSINNVEDLEDQFDKMERNVFDLINKKRKGPVNANETTFLGEINGTRRQEKRRKFLYEL